MIPSRRDFLKAIGGLAAGGGSLLAWLTRSGAREPRVVYALCSADGYAMHRVGPWWECTYDRQGLLKSIEPMAPPRRSEELAAREHPNGDVTFVTSGWCWGYGMGRWRHRRAGCAAKGGNVAGRGPGAGKAVLA